jgi:hypothetical protein
MFLACVGGSLWSASASQAVQYQVNEADLRGIALDHIHGFSDGTLNLNVAKTQCALDAVEKYVSVISTGKTAQAKLNSASIAINNPTVAGKLFALEAKSGYSFIAHAKVLAGTIKVSKIAAGIAELFAWNIAKLGVRIVFGATDDACATLTKHLEMSADTVRAADWVAKNPKRYVAYYSVDVYKHDRQFRADTCIWEEYIDVLDLNKKLPLGSSHAGHLTDTSSPAKFSAEFKLTMPFGCPGDTKSDFSGDSDSEGTTDSPPPPPPPPPPNPTGPPDTSIAAGTTNPTTNDFRTVSFSSVSGGATFECQFDAQAYSACTSPRTYTLVALGTHTVHVRAIANGLVDESPASTSWTRIRPTTTLTGTSLPGSATTTALHHITFTFTSDETAANDNVFQCDLDSTGWLPCESPRTYTQLSEGAHNFRVRAVVLGAEDLNPPSRPWTVTPPSTEITNGPPDSTNKEGTVFFKSPNDPEATFECRFSTKGVFTPWEGDCKNPRTYTGYTKGAHTIEVRAVDLGAKDPTPAKWEFTRT